MDSLINHLNAHIDKVVHFLGGFFVCMNISIIINPVFAMLCTVGIAAGKEIRDKRSGKGTPEYWDFIATVAGGVWAVALAL